MDYVLRIIPEPTHTYKKLYNLCQWRLFCKKTWSFSFLLPFSKVNRKRQLAVSHRRPFGPPLPVAKVRVYSKVLTHFLVKNYSTKNSLSDIFREICSQDLLFFRENWFSELIYRKTFFDFPPLRNTTSSYKNRSTDNFSMDSSAVWSMPQVNHSDQRLVVRRRPSGTPLTAGRSRV
jgi:hypothetical protein